MMTTFWLWVTGAVARTAPTAEVEMTATGLAVATLTWLQIASLVAAAFLHLGFFVFWVTRAVGRFEQRVIVESAAIRQEVSDGQHRMELKMMDLHRDNREDIAVLKQLISRRRGIDD